MKAFETRAKKVSGAGRLRYRKVEKKSIVERVREVLEEEEEARRHGERTKELDKVHEELQE